MAIDFEQDYGVNAGYVEALYEEWKTDPERVEESWRRLFERGAEGAPAATSAAAPTPSIVDGPAPGSVRSSAAATPRRDAVPAAAATPAGPPSDPGFEFEPLRGVAGRIVANMTASLELPTATSVRTLSAKMDSTMTAVEEAIYQTKNRSSQDPLNFPVRLNDKLANLMGQAVDGDFAPTQQAIEVREYLFRLTDEQLAKWKAVKERDLLELNRLVRDLGVDLIRVK